MRKRAAESDKKKTYRGSDRVTVLGLVFEKMTERVVCPRQEEEDRRVRQEVRNSPCEEDVETTEGEGVDFLGFPRWTLGAVGMDTGRRRRDGDGVVLITQSDLLLMDKVRDWLWSW